MHDFFRTLSIILNLISFILQAYTLEMAHTADTTAPLFENKKNISYSASWWWRYIFNRVYNKFWRWQWWLFFILQCTWNIFTNSAPVTDNYISKRAPWWLRWWWLCSRRSVWRGGQSWPESASSHTGHSHSQLEQGNVRLHYVIL